MELSLDVIQLFIFLLPGFITIKIVDLKCDVIPKEYKYFLIDALLYSLVIYVLTSPIIQNKGWSHPVSLVSALLIAIALGMIFGEVKNKEYTGLIFNTGRGYLSTHDKIFSLKASEKLFGKWHVIGLKGGKEICGIIRNFNTGNNEMLIEDARWVIGDEDKELAPEASWLYLPPNQDIEYIRSIETAEGR